MSRNASVHLIVGFILLSALPAFGQAPVLRSAYHDYRVVSVVDGLQNPWAIAFLTDGDMLVTERPGRLRIVRDGVLLADTERMTPSLLRT